MDATKATASRNSNGTNTIGYAATAAMAMSEPGTPNVNAAVGCFSPMLTILAGAANATAAC